MATTILSWEEKRPAHAPKSEDEREYRSTDGRFKIEVGYYCGERGGARVAYIAVDLDGKTSDSYRWGTQLNHAVAWCEIVAQGLNKGAFSPDPKDFARTMGKIKIKRLPKSVRTMLVSDAKIEELENRIDRLERENARLERTIKLLRAKAK